jgi:hypothetical protein
MKNSAVFKKKSFYFFFLLCIFNPPLRAEEEIEHKEPKSDGPQTMVENLCDVNLRSIRSKYESFSTESYEEYLNWHLDRTLNPKPYTRRDLAFKFLTEQEKTICNNGTFDKDKVTTWENLELFCALSGTGTYVAQNIDRTKTEIGKVALYHLLSTPTTNIDVLQNRQSVIDCLIQDKTLLQDLKLSFSLMKEAEGPMLALWDDNHFRQSLEGKYFTIPGTKKLNQNSWALFAKNLYDHTMQITNAGLLGMATITLAAYGLVSAVTDVPDRLRNWAEDYRGTPHMLFTHLWKIKHPALFHSALALIGSYFCGYYTKWGFRWAKNEFLLDRVVHILAHNQAQYIIECRNIYNKIKNKSMLVEFEEIRGMFNFFEKDLQSQADLNELITLSMSNTFSSEPSILSNKGKVLRMYDLLLKLVEKIEPMIFSVGKLEAYYSCAKLYREFKEKRVKFCFATYEHAEKPFIQAKKFWHPLIDENVVIPNSIEIGINNKRPNMIITGPNAGGKSCIIKALALCLFTAQTIGIAPAKSLRFAPFTSISTYLNITDDINEGNSLFKAEVERAQNLINELEKSKPTDFYFLAFDEIFNGTSFIEGTAAAYGCAKYLGRFPNSINAIATHFPIISELESQTETYSNYKVSVNKNKCGTISYPYKLETGVSDQHVALDILKNEGFNGAILEEAENIVKILKG